MIGSTRIISIAMAAALLPTVSGYAQTIDPAIARELAHTWAIDNHAHPVLAPPSDKTDKDFDALAGRCDGAGIRSGCVAP